jgi:hypothetical protein
MLKQIGRSALGRLRFEANRLLFDAYTPVAVRLNYSPFDFDDPMEGLP